MLFRSRVQDNLRLPDPRQSTTDFEFSKKKESGTEASGAPLTEPLTPKRALCSDSEAIKEIPQTQKQTSQFPLWIRTKEQKQHLQTSQDSSLATSINHRSHQTEYQHHLWELWLTSLQPQLSRAPSLEPPDLEYPPEQPPHWEESGTVSSKTLQTIEEIEVLMLLGDQTLTVEVGVRETPKGTQVEIGRASCRERVCT